MIVRSDADIFFGVPLKPVPAVIHLRDVLATEDLAEAARSTIASAVTRDDAFLRFPDDATLHHIVAVARTACSADSAGISLFDNRARDELRWAVVEGDLAGFESRRFPLRHSLCGVCFDRRSTQLFKRPHRYFQWMALNDIFIELGLVHPVVDISGAFIGTIWVMTNEDSSTQFSTDAVATLAVLAEEIVRIIHRTA